MTREEINAKCCKYIEWIGNIGGCILEEVDGALWNNMAEHNFSENDLKLLEQKHGELYDVWNNLPSFELCIKEDKPLGCDIDNFNPICYPCSECHKNTGYNCESIMELEKLFKEIENAQNK